MRIETLMSTPAVSALAPEPLQDVVQRMHDQRVGSVVVVDGSRPVGIVTERDVVRVAAAKHLGDLAVGDVMSDPVDTIELDLDPRVALGRMRERGYRHMPVVRGGELVGVVSLRDLMRVAEIGPPEVPRGLKGVVVADTEVGDVRGNEGFYHYRQHSAIELAERRPLEDVWRLLIDGALPASQAERDAFAAEVAPLRALPASVVPVLPAIALSSTPMEGLRTTLSLVAASRGMRPTIDLDAGERRRDALLLCAVTPTVLCALHRLATGRAPIPPDPELGWAANYLWMLQGTRPADEHVWAIERYLISTIDHGFNASTFTARVVASTGADMGACLVAAVGALERSAARWRAQPRLGPARRDRRAGGARARRSDRPHRCRGAAAHRTGRQDHGLRPCRVPHGRPTLADAARRRCAASAARGSRWPSSWRPA